jgi:glycosyltransferase involved in cell wall biosynthesis
MEPRVDVLIVTLGLAGRAASIRRAIETTLSQQRVRASLVIVVNGKRFDPALYDELKRTANIRVVYQEEPSIFVARRCARDHVTAPFFGFLDDDDQLLPGALRARVDALLGDPSAAAVVANGYLANGRREMPMLDDVARTRANPLRDLMRGNWLATASAMFRTASIPADFFSVDIRSIDMTYVAFRLARERNVVFLDAPTYRKTYSDDSISLSDNWALEAPATLQKLLAFDMPASIRRSLRRKYACAEHDASDILRGRGQLRLAWRCHLRSLADPWGFFAFGLSTRHLLVRRAGERDVRTATSQADDDQ